MSSIATALRNLRFVFLAIGFGSFAARSLAQGPAGHGALAGTVRLPLGAAATGAVVQAKGADDTIHRATADAAGRYTVTDLPPGTYDVSVAVPGVRAFEKKGV